MFVASALDTILAGFKAAKFPADWHHLRTLDALDDAKGTTTCMIKKKNFNVLARRIRIEFFYFFKKHGNGVNDCLVTHLIPRSIEEHALTMHANG